MTYTKYTAPEIVSQEVKALLAGRGLTAKQINSQVAGVVADTFINEDTKAVLAEIKARGEEAIKHAAACTIAIEQRYAEASKKIDEIGDTILAIKEATGEWGDIQNQDMKDLISAYAAMLSIQKKYDFLDPESIGYILYAACGGQAARNYFVSDGESYKPFSAKVKSSIREENITARF